MKTVKEAKEIYQKQCSYYSVLEDWCQQNDTALRETMSEEDYTKLQEAFKSGVLTEKFPNDLSKGIDLINELNDVIQDALDVLYIYDGELRERTGDDWEEIENLNQATDEDTLLGEYLNN